MHCWAFFREVDLGAGGIADHDLTSYLTPPGWCLIHLHGSTRWTRAVNRWQRGAGQSSSRQQVINGWDPAADPPTRDSIYERSDPVADDPRFRVPALAAPLASKATFEWPPRHVAHLRTVLTQSDFVMTIGWRALLRRMGHSPKRIKIMQVKMTRNPTSSSTTTILTRDVSASS
jgi:hypothetical protein